MKTSPPNWVDPLMRVGYAARGVVYVLLGAFALTAALGGGSTPDSKTALAKLLDMPLGNIMLGLVVIGLLAYALWKFVDAAWDLDGKGDDPQGWGARSAQVISGVIHLTVAASVTPLLFGSTNSQNGGDQKVEHWTAVLMQQPLGRWLIGFTGAIAVGIGVQHFIRACKESYKENLRYTARAERLDPLVKLGLIAHGAVVVIVGVFFLWAAWSAEPSRAGGTREALVALRTSEGGHILFLVMALGLLGFAVYCFIEAAYRIVPRCVPTNFETLASRARAALPDALRSRI